MYTPKHFEVSDHDSLFQLMQNYPLGTLITIEEDGINANHIPFEIIRPNAEAPFGMLRGHVARANPVWENLNVLHEALIVFQGPQAYITPTWYEEKQLSGKVVPTYNFAVVHAYGRLQIKDDAQWLHQHLEHLTDQQERQQTTAWKVDDAPNDYVQKLMSAIVGIEIPLTRVSGKWKTSQNRSQQDRINIAAGLRSGQDATVHGMAELVTRQSS